MCICSTIVCIAVGLFAPLPDRYLYSFVLVVLLLLCHDQVLSISNENVVSSLVSILMLLLIYRTSMLSATSRSQILYHECLTVGEIA